MLWLGSSPVGVRLFRVLGTMGWRQKSTYIQPSSSMSHPYNNELKEHLGPNTIEYYKASSVLGKLASHAYDETKAANAETKAAVAKIFEAYAETKAAVAKETEARIKVIELTRDLLDANGTLRLKGMLVVRGILRVERLISCIGLQGPQAKTAVCRISARQT